MIKTLYLQNVGPASELNFNFAPRLNILTGDNGLGKTFVLDIIWATLTTTWAGERAFPARPKVPSSSPQPATIRSILESRVGVNINLLPETVATYNRRSQTWESTWHVNRKQAEFKPKEEQIDPAQVRPQSLVIYARTDGGFHIWDSYQAPPTIQEYHRATVQLSPRELWDGKEVEDKESGVKKVVCEGLIKDWVRWQEAGAAPFEYLRRVLLELSPPNEPLIPDTPTRVLLDDRRDIPTLALPYGTVPVTLASAGMRRVMGMAYALVWAWEEHKRAARVVELPPIQDLVLLVDEIEAHLHPQWQRRILPALMRAIGMIAPQLAIQLVVSTHAPLILASIEPLFNEGMDDLFHFELDGSVVTAKEIPFTKQGRVGAWLISNAFGLSSDRSLQATAAIDAAMAFMRDDREAATVALKEVEPTDRLPKLSLKERIHEALCMHLASHDPFWARWSVTYDKREQKARRKKS